MRGIFSRAAVYILAAAGLLVMSQCSDDEFAPFEPEVTSAPDNFQLQASQVLVRTATLNYAWTCTGTQAVVNHSTTTTAGSAQVIILDAEGAVVYDHALVPSLSDTTSAGVSGQWVVRLVLSHFSGDLNFRIQKR